VFDCVVDHAKVSICGKMVVYQIGFFLLKNPYIVPIDITNLSRFMTGKPLANFPLIFMFAGV